MTSSLGDYLVVAALFLLVFALILAVVHLMNRLIRADL